MKTRILYIFFPFFLLIFAFTSINNAQEKPRALKFDEFDDVTEDQFYSDRKELTFRERVERFSKQLEKERGKTVFVIYYQSRIVNTANNYWSFPSRVERIKNEILYNERIKVKDVVIVDGGHRENKTVELWIVPLNAEPPMPRPTVEASEVVVCPNIFFYGNVPLNKTNEIRFIIPSYLLKDIKDYSLTWKVSNGEIISGQGTDEIEVRLEDTNSKKTTAFLEVGGLPFPCKKTFSATEEINENLRLIDDFGLTANGDIKARLDSFLSSLFNNPTTSGYIIIYGNRDQNGRDMARRETLIMNHFRFRSVDISRISVLRGGFRDEISTELWLSFDDSVKPILTPTVDEKFVVFPKSTTKPRSRKKSK